MTTTPTTTTTTPAPAPTPAPPVKAGDPVVAQSATGQVAGTVTTVNADGSLAVAWVAPPTAVPAPAWATTVGAVCTDVRGVAWQYTGECWRSVRAEYVGAWDDLTGVYGTLKPLA